MNLFSSYVRLLFNQCVKTYGILALIVNIGTFFLITPTWLWMLIPFLTLFIGGFCVYREMMEARPKSPRLSVQNKTVKFKNAGWAGSLPLAPMKIFSRFDLNNTGEEKAKLYRISVTNCDLLSPLFTAKPSAMKLFTQNLPSRDWIQNFLPCEIPGRDWKGFQCEIPIDLRNSEPEEFAKFLKDLKGFIFNLDYEYQDMDGRPYRAEISLSGSYDEWKEQVIHNWIDRKRPDLVSIAKEIVSSKNHA